MEAQEIIAIAEKRSEFVTDVDGFIYYLPSEPTGYFSAEVLRILADELDRRNGPWNGVIQNDPVLGGPVPGANA